MKDREVADREFQKMQNKFRGLVSGFRSRKFVNKRSTQPSATFRLGLRHLLLDSRSALHPSQFDDFLTWVHLQMQGQVADLAHYPIGYDELSGVYTRAPVVTLQRELLWVTSRIKVNANKINMFRSMAAEVEQLVFRSKADHAIEALERMGRDFGACLWSVQLRIALENLAGGLERQKKYTAEVRGVYKRGLLSFIAYHTSVRNEERSTFNKYCDDIKTRIENHQYYDQSLKSYARYRLVGELPTRESGLAEILRVEQSHSLIDAYETFVAIAQEITRREDLVGTREVLETCLQSLACVEDFRLEKIHLILNSSYGFNEFNGRNIAISDALLTGDVQLATRIARKELRSPDLIDCWQYIYSGFAFSHATRPRVGIFNSASGIPSLLSKVLGRCDCGGESIAQLEKVVANWRGLPCVAGIIDLIQLLRRPSPDAPWRPWLISMNSPTVGVEDCIPGTYSKFIKLSIDNSRAIGPTEVAWGRFHGHDFGITDVCTVGIALFTTAGLLCEGQFELAIEFLTHHNRDVEPEPIRSITATMLLHAYFGLGHRQSVIELVADEGSRGTENIQLLPILPALENYVWDDYKNLSLPLAAPIALHLLWSLNESSITASYLRYATSVAIKKSGIKLPSMLIGLSHAYPRHQLIYFLKKVCVPEILDLSRVLKNTREVLEERMAICTALRNLDGKNAGAHQDEAMAISYQLALDEGQWIVHRTRVHVDDEALLRWAMREFSEDFSRYRDLLSLDIGEKQSFDDVLKELTAPTASSKRSIFTPDNEADAVLLSILTRCREEFLNNPNFGFDFYLSKRIRHQSFIGLIRGPLEFSNLITTRESESGVYHRNDFWINKFMTLNSTEKEILNNSFVKFSVKFDETLIAAKDKQFHLRSHEYPAGLFNIEFTSQLIALVRTVLRNDTTLSDFIFTVIAVLWGAIEPSLADARRFVTEELKTKISQGVDEFRASVRKIADRDPTLFDLDMEIGQRSTEVQRALDDVSSWFSHADVDAMKRYFTLEQIVDIAVDSALRCRRPFTPEISRKIESDCEMLSATSLVFVHDVLFTAFDNARTHSGHQTPKVVIFATAEKTLGTLTVEVISEANPEQRTAQEEQLREIRQLIDSGNFERRTRKEGKSGILKLAAVVHQSSKGKIDYGFTDDCMFKLKVTHSLIVEETTNFGAICE